MSSVEVAAFGARHTPEQVLIDALNNAGEMKSVVIIYIDNEDYVMSSWSQAMTLTRIGMLEAAKSRQLDLMQEAGDGD